MSDVAQRSSPALEVSELTGGYGAQNVLRSVSLAVCPGEVVALLGPNGAGKTTLLEMVGGSLRPSAGRVLMRGEDVTSLSTRARVARGLCHVPEGHAIYRSLTVRENLQMQAGGRSAEKRAGAVFDAFPVLAPRLDQVAGTLSGGEQQMLAMSVAYLRDPALVLIDEPSLGLAPLIVDRVFDGLRILARSGAALLIVDQYAAKLLDMASRAYVMRQGEIVLSDAAAVVRRSDLFSEYLGS